MARVADFETIVNTDATRVWAWAVYSIYEEVYEFGTDIDDFMEYASKNNDDYYFHNLKFDGEFIFVWLFENGFKYADSINGKPPKLKPKEFTAIIADTGQFYKISIQFSKRSRVDIYDSLKILPFDVSAISGAFGIKDMKLIIDYKQNMEIGHKLTQEEIDYIKNDVTIVGKALKILFSQGLNRMTQGGNALADYKKIIGYIAFKYWYPELPYDEDIRKSYKGGFTYLADGYAGKDIGEGMVFDVNSLYPSVMYNELLPYGTGKRYKGKYTENSEFPLYVQIFTCCFDIKPGYIPTIQIKKGFMFAPNEYIKSSNGQDITLCLTSVDLELFLEHYNVYNIQWEYGYMFRGAHGLFKQYIDKWIEIKIKADLEGNIAMRTLAKLMLNALYGKFGLNPDCRHKTPYYNNGIIGYHTSDKERRRPLYIPMATFITAYARKKTITTAQSLKERFVYADTDSLHLIGQEMPNIDIHDTKLGAWKHESNFSRARFIRQKSYIEMLTWHKNKNVDKLSVTCAGLPKKAHNFISIREMKRKLKCGGKWIRKQEVNFDTFMQGATFYGKLTPKHVIGGVVLIDTAFTIR